MYIRKVARFGMLLILITIAGRPTIGLSQAAGASVSTSFSGLVYNRATQTFNSVLTITNTGPTLSAPLGIFISTNVSTVTVIGANSLGEIFDTQLPGNSLPTGATAQVTVAFVNPTKSSFKPTALVIGGGQMLLQVLQSLQATGVLPTLDTSSSVAGTDANQNGIRDDIDVLIASLPDTPAQQAALSQEARNLETSLTADTTNASGLNTLGAAIDRGVACVYLQYPAATANDRLKWLEMMTANTPARIQAYLAFNQAMNGYVSHAATSGVCGA